MSTTNDKDSARSQASACTTDTDEQRTIVTLADKGDTYNFTVGPMKIGYVTSDGRLQFRDPTWRDKAKDIWHRITWWHWPRMGVVAIDHIEGSITMGALRWSWLRWKWAAK
jgi:hypothetical protein